MIHGWCVNHVTQIHQKPEKEAHFAVFPPAFHVGGDESVSQAEAAAEVSLPGMHTNYKNRAMDVKDLLPKLKKTFPPDNPLNNDGSPK